MSASILLQAWDVSRQIIPLDVACDHKACDMRNPAAQAQRKAVAVAGYVVAWYPSM